MTATSTATQQKPTAVVEIERLGFSWTEVSDYDLTKVDPDFRVQVREDVHYAPKETVEQYAVMMGETPFPPIVVTKDNVIVDGNTRVKARIQRKEKFTPALQVEADWHGATDKTRDLLIALAATLNAQGGVRLTAKETRVVAKHLIQLGWKTEQIGRAIGLKSGSVTQVKKEIDAASKLSRVGLDPNGNMRGASLRALGSKDVLSLNDVPFKELATLASDAGLNASEIVTTAKNAKETGSDAAQVELISNLRTEFGDRIRERELTGIGKPPVSRQLRQHLGFVRKFFNREQELIETDPNVSPMHAETIRDAITVLTEVLKMQEG
jgi:hypothetical protein